MHERSKKNTPLDTVLYEIDMLRHCARVLPEKKRQREQTCSDPDRAEYYLCIEGFLLHLRNLLAFFTNQHDKPTDLGINEPEQWAGRQIEQREYSDLMKAARAINDKHGTPDSSCCDQVSKFLQHCTTYRHEQVRDWDIENIFAELNPILVQFEQRFISSAAPAVATLASDNYSTASFRTFSVLFDDTTKPEGS